MRLTATLFTAFALFAAKEPAPILSDGFEGASIDKAWRAAKGDWKQSGGVLTGAEIEADKHAAALRRKLGFGNAMIQLRFRLDGARQTTLSINHANGHLSRVIIRPEGFWIQMDPDKVKGTKAEVLARSKEPLKAGVWHDLTVTFEGTKMTARIGAIQLTGDNPALTTPKADIGLTVGGKSVAFDSIRVYGQN
jgi:hypothetical protein